MLLIKKCLLEQDKSAASGPTGSAVLHMKIPK